MGHHSLPPSLPHSLAHSLSHSPAKVALRKNRGAKQNTRKWHCVRIAGHCIDPCLHHCFSFHTPSPTRISIHFVEPRLLFLHHLVDDLANQFGRQRPTRSPDELSRRVPIARGSRWATPPSNRRAPAQCNRPSFPSTRWCTRSVSNSCQQNPTTTRRRWSATWGPTGATVQRSRPPAIAAQCHDRGKRPTPDFSCVVSSPTAAWGSSRTEANGRPTSLPASLHHCSDDDLLPHGRQRPTHGRQRRAHSIAVSVRATLRHDTAGAFAQHMPWPGAPRDPPRDPGCARQFSALLVLHFASPCVRKNLRPSNKDRIDPRRPLCGGGPLLPLLLLQGRPRGRNPAHAAF